MRHHKLSGSFSKFSLGVVVVVNLCCSSLVLGVPDKVPSNYHPIGLDQQSLASNSRPTLESLSSGNKQAKELSYGGGGSNIGGIGGIGANSNLNSFAAFDYAASNNVNVGVGGQAKDSSGGYSNSFGPSAGPVPSQQAAASGGYPTASVDQSYGPPSHSGSYNPVNPAAGSHGDAQGQSYAYYYQHYPASSGRPSSHLSPGDESFFDGFGDFGGGLAGLGGLGGLGGVLALAKGILAIKPFLLFGLLLLLGIPLLLLFLPIPIITVSGMGIGGNTNQTPGQRQYGQGPSMITSYVSQISDRILNSEECLERILCKMPQVPGKFQGKAKILWEQYGKKYFNNNYRVQRAVTAYFDESVGTGRSRVSKCNQKFKCSNKFF